MNRRYTTAGRRGVVYAEVVIALVPIMFTFLGICQYSLLYAGQLVVQHAATRAARAAMVIVDDDPAEHDGAARGVLSDGETKLNQGLLPSVMDSLGELGPELSFLQEKLGGKDGQEGPAAGARWEAIRSAAYHPVSVLAPSVSDLLSPNLRSSLASDAISRVVLGRLLYAPGATSVTIHDLHSKEMLTEVAHDETMLVRVSFIMPCTVPLVASLMCQSARGSLLDWLGVTENERQEEIKGRLSYVGSPLLRDSILQILPRFIVISGEAVMPNHGARYHARTMP